jgi:hypothetical protein
MGTVMKNRLNQLLLGVYLLLVAGGALGLLGVKDATGSLDIRAIYKHVYEDRIRNWDYHDDPSHDDMPVDLFFTNGATIASVDDAFSRLFPQKVTPSALTGLPDWAFSKFKSPGESAGKDNETNGRTFVPTREHFYIDSSRGMKDYGCAPVTHHIRVYAPKSFRDGSSYPGFNPDSLYSRRYGYYVYATSHEDHNEPQCKKYHLSSGSTEYGYSENVEGWIAHEYTSQRSKFPKVSSVAYDRIWMNNQIGWPRPLVNGEHVYFNDGKATRFFMHPPGASASSVNSPSRPNQYPAAALTRYYDYHNGGGSGDHWTTTGPADSEHDVVEGTLGFLENTRVPGTAPLYECESDSWEHFLSRDVSCAPGDLEGLAGYIFTSQSSVASTPLLSCQIGEEIFESTTCEGWTTRGTLGYLKGVASLRRYAGGAVDHHVSTGPGPAGATLESTPLGSLIQGYAANRHALYSCEAIGAPRDHFLSKSRSCEGHQLLALEGYAYDSPPAGVPTTQIYRCWYPGGHFVSNQSNCEGLTTEFSLGYTYGP